MVLSGIAHACRWFIIWRILFVSKLGDFLSLDPSRLVGPRPNGGMQRRLLSVPFSIFSSSYFSFHLHIHIIFTPFSPSLAFSVC